MGFRCNICGAHSPVPGARGREEYACGACGAILRWRSVVAALSTAVHGRSLVIDEFPPRPDLVGLGTSDWEGYAERLSTAFAYRNTYLHHEPRLDVASPPPPELLGSCDFVLSSDVLEHVVPPYRRSLAHLRAMLRPGGVLVLTVPMAPAGETDEHFPDLHEHAVVELGPRPVLVNRTAQGDLQVFDDLVFHGGEGSTLEMRVVSAPDLLAALEEVGFVDVRPFSSPIPDHGIEWEGEWTWPVTARAPG